MSMRPQIELEWDAIPIPYINDGAQMISDVSILRLHKENKTLKSVTRVKVVDEKTRLDSVRHIHLNMKYLVTLFFFLFTKCHGAKFKHLKLSVHHHLCRESVLQSNSNKFFRKSVPEI